MPVNRLQRDRRISQPDVEAGRRAVLRLRAPQYRPSYSKINRHFAEKNMSPFRLVAKNSREEENTTGEK